MATNMVFAAGDPDAGLLLIGGPPGADEDRSGLPFAGREGALLDQMLASVGLTRTAMLLAPLIPWRPPGGRVPNPGELQLYRPFLLRLDRVGGAGADCAVRLARGEHGAWRRATRSDDRLGRGADRRTMTPVLIIPALAELLKTPARRKDAWAGMRLLRRALDG